MFTWDSLVIIIRELAQLLTCSISIEISESKTVIDSFNCSFVKKNLLWVKTRSDVSHDTYVGKKTKKLLFHLIACSAFSSSSIHSDLFNTKKQLLLFVNKTIKKLERKKKWGLKRWSVFLLWHLENCFLGKPLCDLLK